jgi:hypothetical protein
VRGWRSAGAGLHDRLEERPSTSPTAFCAAPAHAQKAVMEQ